jgi:flagellar biosynthesis anti-sigma factor FlgM
MDMRIDQNLPISETVQSERVSGTTTGQANSTSKSDSSTPDVGVSLSSQQLQATLDATPDIRQDKVAALQKAMREGTYNVSSQDLAGAVYNSLIQKTAKL